MFPDLAFSKAIMSGRRPRGRHLDQPATRVYRLDAERPAPRHAQGR